MTPWINMGAPEVGIVIDKACEHYASRTNGRVVHIGSFAPCNHKGEWGDYPFELFWQEKPEKAEYSQYFMLSHRGGSVYISDGRYTAQALWYGLMHPQTGEIIFSRFRHDYRRTRDDSIMVDGGPDPRGGRSSGNGTPVVLKIVDDQMTIHQIRPRPDREIEA